MHYQLLVHVAQEQTNIFIKTIRDTLQSFIYELFKRSAQINEEDEEDCQ